MASICGYDSIGNARTAAEGYDCTVLPVLSIWGFCPTTVIVATDCGFTGYCYDSHHCSTGCGPYPSSLSVPYLTVVTCSESQSCSFVNSDNGGGQVFSNIGCGDVGGTVTLYPTPPKVAASTTSTFLSSTTSSHRAKSTTIPTSTSSTSPTISGSSSLAMITASSVNIIRTTSSSTPASTATASAMNHSTPPYVPIIGGVLGGLAILCLTVLAVFLIRRRKSSPRRDPPSYQDHDAYYNNPVNRSHNGDLYGHQFQRRHEMGRKSAMYEAQAYRDPAELPS